MQRGALLDMLRELAAASQDEGEDGAGDEEGKLDDQSADVERATHHRWLGGCEWFGLTL